MKHNHFHYHSSSEQGAEQGLTESEDFCNASPNTLLEDIQMLNRQSSLISLLQVDQAIAYIRSG